MQNSDEVILPDFIEIKQETIVDIDEDIFDDNDIFAENDLTENKNITEADEEEPNECDEIYIEDNLTAMQVSNTKDT